MTNAFTFHGGNVREGIATQEDEKFGKVIFLGEEGRGRRYEKISIARQNGAQVTEGRIYDLFLKKIVLEATADKKEKIFFVAEKPATDYTAVLVRINTQWTYTKCTVGTWSFIAGTAKPIISGYGAHGIAGRIGNWDDGIVEMHVGDVIRVTPEGGSKVYAFALWISDDGKPQTLKWQDWEQLQVVTKAQAFMAEAEVKAESQLPAYGTMPIFDYAVNGESKSGLSVIEGVTGQVVRLGEDGRGRKRTDIPLMGLKVETKLDKAALVVLSEKMVKTTSYSSEEVLVRSYALTSSDFEETDSFMVRVHTPDIGRKSRTTKVVTGAPELVGRGRSASGDAGAAGQADDTLWVLKHGDAVVVEGHSRRVVVVENIDGKPVVVPWQKWELADAKKNPEAYVAKGKAIWGHIPTEWIGKIVSIMEEERGDYNYTSGQYETSLHETQTGEIVSISPLVLNLGWDGRDLCEVTITKAVWINLQTDKDAYQLQGEEAEKRLAVHKERDIIRAEAQEVAKSDYFKVLKSDLRKNIEEVANATEYSGRAINFAIKETWELEQWNRFARELLEKVAQLKNEASELAEQQAKGEKLVEFQHYHRRGGRTGNGDAWVIRSDGTRREPDSNDVPRHKSDGVYHWDMILPDELALMWECHHTGDVTANSVFTVAKMPVNGLTSAQVVAVAEIEKELGVLEGTAGFNAEAKASQDAHLEQIRLATKRLLGYVPENLTYFQVVGTDGIGLSDKSLFSSWSAKMSQCCNRDAAIVRSVLVADGVLEVLAYRWGGEDNVNLRWRKSTMEDVATPIEAALVEEEAVVPKVGDAQFIFEGQRFFRCPNGHAEKMIKSDYKRYEAGEAVELHCTVSNCKSAGIVSK